MKQDIMQNTESRNCDSARNRNAKKIKIVGLLISDITNSHFSSMVKIIESILRSEGYNLIVCCSEDDPEIEREYLNQLMLLRADGLIINPTGENVDYISEISKSTPIILIDRNIKRSDFIGDFIGSNNFEGVRSMTRHLLDYGHRNIGVISCGLNVSTGLERMAGFTTAMSEIGINANIEYLYRYHSEFFSVEGGADGCRYLLNLENPPTAIIVLNNTMALGVYKYLHRMNYRVPNDISVISYGNIENSELFNIEPTHVTLNPYFIGEKAAKNLLSRIHSPKMKNREVIFEPHLIVNKSTKAFENS